MNPFKLSRLTSRSALLLTAAAIQHQAHAASGAWNMDTAGNWSLNTNWNPAVVPGTAEGDVVDLTFDITAARTVTIDTTSRTVGDLNIGDPTATLFGYTLASSGGAVLNLNGTGSSDATIDFTANIANPISAPITLADNGVIRSNVAAGHTISGVISGTGRSLTFNNDTHGTVNAPVSLLGAFAVTGNNTYTGGTTIDDVRVNVTTNNTALGAAGSAVNILDGGQLYLSTALANINYAFTVAGNGWAEPGFLGALRVDGGATVTGSVTLASAAGLGSNGTGTLSGPIIGTAALSKVAAGTLSFTGNMAGYTGAVTVSSGTLSVGDTTATGGLSTASGVTIANNATLAIRNTGTQNSSALIHPSLTFGGAASVLAFTPAAAGTVVDFNTDLGTSNTLGALRLTGGTGNVLSGTDVLLDEIILQQQSLTNLGTLNILAGSTVNVRDWDIGSGTNNSGIVNQSGGTVTAPGGGNIGLRIGHWGSNATGGSQYNLSGGTLDITGASPGVTPSGTGEQTTGGFYLGIDGLGNFTQSGSSIVNTKFVVLDNRSATTGIDTLTLNGGTLNLTANWGIIARNPLSTLVTLNGGNVINAAAAGTAVVIDTPVTVGASGGTLDTSANATSSLVLTSSFTGANNVTLAGAGKLVFNPNSKATLDGTSDGLGTQTIASNLGGTGTPVEKVGTGTTTLSGINTYTGTTTVAAGTLNLTGSINNSALTAAASTTISGEGSAASISTAGAFNLTITPSTAGALTSVGTLTMGADVATVSFNGITPLTAFTVVNYGSTDATAASFALSNPASYRAPVFTVGATSTTLALGNKALIWTGTGGSVWDVNGTANWNDPAASTSFYGDLVTFDDSPGVNQTITLAGSLQPGSITVNNSAISYTFTASAGNILSGATPLLKTGTNALTMAGNVANTFTGGTTISQGTINVQNGGSLGTGTVTLGDASTGANNTALYLDTNRSNFTVPVVVSNNGSGTATLGSRSTVIGTGDNNQFTNITLQRDVIFDSNAADRTDYENVTGTGNVTVTGVGRSIFMTANSYVGNLTVANGVGGSVQLGTVSGTFNAIPDASNLTVDAGGLLRLSYTSGGTETVNGLSGAGTINLNTTTAFTNTLIVGSSGGGGTFSGLLENGSAGSIFALTKNGAGTQILTGNNTYTGATAINGGTLQVGNGGATGQLGVNSAPTLAAGTTLTFNRTGATGIGALGSGAAAAGTLNIDGGVALSLNAGGGFSGIININNGSLVINATNATGTAATSATFNLAPGTTLTNTTTSAHQHVGNINMNAATWTTGAGTGNYNTENYQFNGTATVTGSAPSLITREAGRTDANSGVALGGNRTFDVGDVTGSAAADLTVSTELENSDTSPADDGFTKVGAGTMLLANANSYSGQTNVNGGTLLVNGSISGTGAVTVNTGGTLGGTGSVAGALTVNAGGTVAPGTSAGNLAAGATTITGSYACEIDGANEDTLVVTGALNITGATLNVSVLGGGATLPEYIIATYTGALTGTFTIGTPLPAGYTVNYATAGQIKIVSAQSYSAWAANFLPNPGAAGVDFENDGFENGTEFILGGSPLSGSNNPKIHSLVADSDDVGTDKELIMTIAVPVGTPAFTAGSPTSTASFVGYGIAVRGSTTLAGFPVTVNPVAPVTTGLPALVNPQGGVNYEYRSFSLDGSNGTPSRGFLQVVITNP